MTLFPSLLNTFYVDQDQSVKQMWEYFYTKYSQVNLAAWSEMDLDNRFAAGDQSLYSEGIYGQVLGFRNNHFNFNRIRRIINMIQGYQRQHRKSTICTPIESSDEETADQFTKLLYHINTKGHVLETISDAFEGSLIGGMNLLAIWQDYRRDPVNGEIVIDNVGYNAYMIDPYFKKADLSDCNCIMTRKYLSREQVMSLLPGREDEISNVYVPANRDGKFQYLPESYNYGMQDLIIYDEMWYLDSRRQKIIADVQTGESKEWTGDDETLREYLQRFPTVTMFEHEVPTVKLAIMVQGKVMYNGPNPLGFDAYPFVPVFAYYQPQIPSFSSRIQGIVRGLRDAQYLYNRRKIIELDILESQISSGGLFRENDLVNPKDVFLQGPGRWIPVKETGKPITDSFAPLPPPQIPPSMIQLSELLGKEISEISGVNEELLGSATDDKAGILGMLRQGAGLVTLQILFDNLDRAQKLLGDLTIKTIQHSWTPGKVKRILGEEPTQQFYNHAFGQYDAIVEEGLNTSTQRQLEFAQLLQLRETGIPVPTSTLVEVSTLQGKKKLIAGIQAEEKAAQDAQGQAQQVQIQLLQAQIEDLKARAMANEGLGVERASRVTENQALAVERVAAAQKDREMATTEHIKAAKELASIDLDQLHRAMEILKGIQEMEAMESGKLTKQTLEPTKPKEISTP